MEVRCNPSANSDVFAYSCKWRRHGANVAVLDLNKAYLQLHVDEPLWSFQTVMMRDPQYCLKRLSFGLNIPPLAIRAVKTILTKDPEIAHTLMTCWLMRMSSVQSG